MVSSIAANLVTTYLELTERIRLENSRKGNWKEYLGKHNSIAIIYNQFVALLKAIDLFNEELNPEEVVRKFENGGFIQSRPVEKYAVVYDLLAQHNPGLLTYTFWKRDVFKYRNVENLYSSLLRFRKANDHRYYGQLEGHEYGGHYGYTLAIQAIDRTVLEKINHALYHIIDPDQTVVDEAKLTTVFGYPLENYERVYLDERVNEIF